eukprot:6547526-Pyramimonas_sp.AAC.1
MALLSASPTFVRTPWIENRRPDRLLRRSSPSSFSYVFVRASDLRSNALNANSSESSSASSSSERTQLEHTPPSRG